MSPGGNAATAVLAVLRLSEGARDTDLTIREEEAPLLQSGNL